MICTVLGLALMHSLGHTDLHHSRAAGASANGHAAEISSSAAIADGDCADCDRASTPTGPGRHGGSFWEICLAVLSGVAAALLLTALLVISTRAHGWARPAFSAPSLSRGPPVRRTGLKLATVSVLRV
ncbi:hypothetical protein GCM10009687_73670 [Asanoa iriomotensis]|uniref:DUF2946 domain-containing protein n=2 Tax=Asanoa iriomotensis TaxID=234613 RepID=A0ABQ4BWA9_9ACTN|nr:hypothetical protein Air01nite_08750 [Asanoa iriomotensis]